jgi:hypothetical protein
MSVQKEQEHHLHGKSPIKPHDNMRPACMLLKNVWGLFLGIYPKDCDTGYSRGTCTPMFMFIAALFTIAKLWK